MTARASAPPPKPRARDLGVVVGRFPPGKHNAITDVRGVRVGHVTRVEGDGPLVPGQGPIRTGVTAILPGKDVFMQRVYGGSYVLNGAGEVVGLSQIDEWGLIETPIVLCSTMCVGRVADATVAWVSREHPGIGHVHDVVIPVVAECDDSYLNDALGRHIREGDVWRALDGAADGPVAEGNVGSGTGMSTFDFAGGIGTSSRRMEIEGEGYTVASLVMSNFGDRRRLSIDGLPVGKLLEPRFAHLPRRESYGSIIVVLATDAPTFPRQLSRVARRAALAIGRTGGYAAHRSGEIVLAFSTANRVPREGRRGRHKVELLLDEALDPIYEATVDVTEEAILNALFAARDMRGQSDHFVPALPHEAVLEAVRSLAPPG